MKPPSPWMPVRDPLALAVLGKLAEELAEAGAVVSRCIIQGIDENEPRTGKPNRKWLEEELADVWATIRVAVRHFGLDSGAITIRTIAKRRHMSAWHNMIRQDSKGERMPQASNRQRNLMQRWFGSIDHSGPIRLLESHGYTLTKDHSWVLPVPSHTISRVELECVRFLIDEWDFGSFADWQTYDE